MVAAVSEIIRNPTWTDCGRQISSCRGFSDGTENPVNDGEFAKSMSELDNPLYS